MSNSYTETANPDICKKLSRMGFASFKNAYDIVKKNDTEVDECGNKIKLQVQYELIKNYANDMISSNYQLKKEYRATKKNPNGRLFVKGYGLQSINKSFRGCLCDGIYTDYDMKNCHPVLLLYICKNHQIPCTKLERYVNDRDGKLEEFCKDNNVSRDIAKRMFLVSMNAKWSQDKVNGKKIKGSFFKEYDTEMKHIQTNLLVRNPDLHKHLKQYGDTDNVEGKVLNHLLCEMENTLLHMCCKDASVLAFDGFMRPVSDDEDTYIETLNELTAEYGVKWDIKPHNIELYDTIMAFDEEHEGMFSEIAEDIPSLAKKLLNNPLKDKLMMCQGSYYYRSKQVWLCDERQIRKGLFVWINNNDLYTQTDDGEKKVSGSVKQIEDIIKCLLMNCPENSRLLDEIFDDSLYKLCFQNGYIDFKTLTFETDYTKCKTTNVVPYDLVFESNPVIRGQLLEKVFKPIFGVCDSDGDTDREELMNHFLYRLSRVMAGHIEDKRWFLLTGMRDCGKGVLCDLLKNTFEFYIRTTSASNFIFKKSNGDCSKENSWIMDYCYRRLAITNEISVDFNRTDFVDGNRIKSFCSGGDRMDGRKNFQNEKEFRIQSSLMICSNDMPSFKPTDCLEKCDEYKLTSKFVTDISNAPLCNIKYYEADDSIKTEFIKDQKVLNEFVMLLVWYYKQKVAYPQSIKTENGLLDDDKTDTSTMIQEYFFFAPDHFISNEELKVSISSIDLNISLSKLKQYLQGLYPGVNLKAKRDGKRGIEGINTHRTF